MTYSLYPLVRRLLFALDPETAHGLSLSMLQITHRLGASGFRRQPLPSSGRKVMGLEFPNPVGLAAGFDKNGGYIDALAAFGFGFLEIGTVTPRPQAGNPRPRLFRLSSAQAIINRMGFNNQGARQAVENIRRSRFEGILGISIGKNRETPITESGEDYLSALQQVYPYASYVALNISSPGTPDLRKLQYQDYLSALLDKLKPAQQELADHYGIYVPLAVKVAPDLTAGEIDSMAENFLEYDVDGVIATNSTVSRDKVAGLRHAYEPGGLSGAPLRERATTIVKQFSRALDGRIPIIASGGVMTAHDAVEKIQAGASLVQIYSGLVYRGPGLIGEICAALA